MLSSRNLRINVLSSVRRCSTLLQTRDVAAKDKTVIDENEWKNAKLFHKIPGPNPVPILGNFWRYWPYIGTYRGLGFHEINYRMNEEYGDIVLLKKMLVTDDTVYLYNPADFEKVLRNEGEAPRRDTLPSIKYYRINVRNEIYGDYSGIASVEGEEWSKARSILNPIMMKPRTVKLYTGPVNEVVDDFIKRIKVLEKQNENGEMPHDFEFEINKWALEVMTKMALEIRLDLLDSNKKIPKDVEEFLQANLDFFDLLFDLDILPNPYQYVSTSAWRKYVKAMDSMTFFTKKILDARMAEKVSESKDENDLTILEKLLKHDKKFLFGTINDLLTGGVDTTARLAHSWFYNIASNPEVQEKLRKEVTSVLPELNTPVTADKLEKMPYLRATIKESLRKAPLGIGILKRAQKDMVLSGYQIPKNTNLILSNLTCCLKEKYFSKPEKFIPERWLRNELKKYDEMTQWIYMPFGFGPRSCVGKRLAILEAEILFSKIIRNFKMEWHHEPMKYKSRLLYGIADPLKIRMISRQN